MRKYGTVRVPIGDVDRVCRKFGVTVNDVALAAITEGFRTVLLRRGQEPRADSLRTLVPTPMRSAMLPYLPVEHDDPVQLLRTVHNRWKVKHADQRQPGIVEAAINILPTMWRSNVLQLLARLPQAGIVTFGTHAPGPRHRLRLMGQTMERLLPIPPTALQLSTGVAVLSYGDERGVRHHRRIRRRGRRQAVGRRYRTRHGAAGGAQPGLGVAVRQGPSPQARRARVSGPRATDASIRLSLTRPPTALITVRRLVDAHIGAGDH